MNLSYLIIGIIVLAISITDLLWTTLWLEGVPGR